MNEWEENGDEWQESGATLEQQAKNALSLLNAFMEIEDPHQEQMEDIFDRLALWSEKFMNLEDSELKETLKETFIKTEIHIAAAYMAIFEKMESPDEETCKFMHVLLKVLEENYNTLTKVMPKKDADALAAEMNNVMLRIAGTYPEILEE